MSLSAEPLPTLLRIVAEIAGEDVALRVSELKGGTIAYIPVRENLDTGHWLVEAAGMSKARDIAAQLGGRSHVIPIGSQRRRQDEIEKLAAEGAGVNAIALALRIDRRTVRRHLDVIAAAQVRAARKVRKRRA